MCSHWAELLTVLQEMWRMAGTMAGKHLCCIQCLVGRMAAELQSFVAHSYGYYTWCGHFENGKRDCLTGDRWKPINTHFVNTISGTNVHKQAPVFILLSLIQLHRFVCLSRQPLGGYGYGNTLFMALIRALPLWTLFLSMMQRSQDQFCNKIKTDGCNRTISDFSSTKLIIRTMMSS